MIVSSFVNYQRLHYQDFEYSLGANVLGVAFALTSASAIPITALFVLLRQKGSLAQVGGRPRRKHHVQMRHDMNMIMKLYYNIFWHTFEQKNNYLTEHKDKL